MCHRVNIPAARLSPLWGIRIARFAIVGLSGCHISVAVHINGLAAPPVAFNVSWWQEILAEILADGWSTPLMHLHQMHKIPVEFPNFQSRFTYNSIRFTIRNDCIELKFAWQRVVLRRLILCHGDMKFILEITRFQLLLINYYDYCCSGCCCLLL